MIFFTSDHHFYHRNSLKFGGRGIFSTVEDMNDYLVACWNSVVAPSDVVWHLGDLSFGEIHDTSRIVERLNGFISILGVNWHHDRNWLRHPSGIEMRSNGGRALVQVREPEEVLRLNADRYGLDFGGHPLTIHMSHYPLLEWEASFHGTSLNLHGHQHRYNKDADGTEQRARNGMRLNMNVEYWDWKPVALDTIVELMFNG